jgi:hypothetical protein
MAEQSALDQLHASLDSRLRPEDVAELILKTAEPFSDAERVLLQRAANSRSRWWYSSMSSDFARPVDASRQIGVLRDLTSTDFEVDAANPAELRAVIAVVGTAIGWHAGFDFKRDRLSRAELKASGSTWSKRQYNRLLRHLARTAAKVDRLDVELRKRELMPVGRSGLAADIPAGRFHADPAAACFVAYFVARKNLRRQFSLSGKTNPMDEIADMLFKRLGDGSDWWMVSRVHPTPQLIARLSATERGELLGRWSALMRGAAGILEGAWHPEVNRTTMIVRRGMDSSTWNTVAQAYNTARSGWLNALAATGTLPLLDVACPGKVMRLMAADLAFWHRSSGSDVDPDTAVWAALPLPWEVLSGTASCTRDYVVETCKRFDVDPVTRGWVGPRATGKVAKFEATPELVHGVSIADPMWAGLLRRAGAFSGKRIKAGYEDIAVPADVVTSDLPSKAISQW